ncbi:Endo-1,4-beta-xylanase A precursor (EC [Lentimonas sp. CC4]|nr:Endo-1,4-beta-xylanase A precursor (EC [Lentimonas sp. CC4]CAA6687423.1 Endo-1,4-beta-xylanase A precursor (EC [Lentimonas sp. CC6]CAA7078005.1 Endo-1,4-beta-xylanase A precursor (EC [Lentimonas sp. CC4]CAA7172051.1 Endo-1,4-beta-xylanase A precursor (EC [Lentimonas sp. CC21]CAA7183593.1 Endo-1,4-beta-xylanase A precursor (EC [Lentimonas sp. CC8]
MANVREFFRHRLKPRMKKKSPHFQIPSLTQKCTQSALLSIGLLFGLNVHAIEDGNPLVSHMFTADPSAHSYEGRIYVYPSHDKDDSSGYNMTDYHVLSSEDLVNWTDHGKVLDVTDVPWASSKMWAPDCAYKDGTYYFYFPAVDSSGDKHIGVATSTSPAGPFVPEDEAIESSFEIDPCVFTDDDGQVYMYWGGHTCNVAKMDSTMKQFDGDIVELEGTDYFYEAAWMHKLNGTYYLSYSTGGYLPDTNEHLIAYATATDPMGPFTYQGIVNGDVSGVTNHHSIMEHQGQWYLFYHNIDLPGGTNTRRSVVADYLHYNDDGTIRQVIQTTLGIGQYNGLTTIEAENYTKTENVEKRENSNDDGLHVIFDPGDELVFTNIDLGTLLTDTLRMKVAATSSTGSIEIRTESGDLLGTAPLTQASGSQVWQTISVEIDPLDGVFNLSLTYTDTAASQLELDWFSFSGETVDPINLALSGIVSQSSTNYDAEAELAIDGNTDGEWLNGSVTHTLEEDQAWWRVDLREPCKISEINIWGRTDSNSDRLSNYDVTILDSSEEVVWTSYQADYPDPSVTLDASSAIGQYVIIQLQGSEALSLAEVEVYGFTVDFPLGLLAEWTMDESSGTDVPDSSGLGYDATVEDENWVVGLEGQALDFDGISSRITLPTRPFAFIQNEITLSMWVYGSSEQPRQDTIFSAADASGNRVLSIHLPWSNSNVYWDAGNSDSSFDRISKTATADQFKEGWNHWTFTKNAISGSMKIYHNGILWHSATEEYLTMDGVTQAYLGSAIVDGSYDGLIDEVRLYNTELTDTEVNALYDSYDSVTAWLSQFTSLEDSSLDGDPDYDSTPTLLEYVLNGDPSVFDDSILPEFKKTEGDYVFKFVRWSKSTEHTTQTFQYSVDLDRWDDLLLTGDTLDPSVSVGEEVDELEEVMITLGAEEAVDGKLFGRLKVEE